jgi:uncharacterized membrane protein
MDLTTLLAASFLSLLPISELRGAIPFAVMRGMDLFQSAILCTLVNATVPLIAFVFLSTLHRLFYAIPLYKKLFDTFIEKARSKVRPKVEKYGYLGLMFFVAIPLPITGAWTGALGAWVLGMNKKKASVAIICGVLVAGIIVSLLVALLGAGAHTIFFKNF